MSTTQFQLDCKAAQKILGSRAMVTLKDAQLGKTVQFNIQGNGNTIPMLNKDGVHVVDSNGLPLYKTIYGVKANSQIAMMNPLNKDLFRQALAAETAGDMDEAHKLYNKYLNKVQVSFNIVLNHGRNNPTFRDKQLVEGEIDLITTENGQLVSMKNVIAAQVDKLGKTPVFSLEELMGVSDEKPTADDVFQPERVDGEKAEA